jgi:hypothetical protein
MSNTLCYTGNGALYGNQHTIPEFIQVMDTNEKQLCIKNKSRKNCRDCAKATQLNSKYLQELNSAGKKRVHYPLENLNLLNEQCNKCIQQNIYSTPYCNLDEYIKYSGAGWGKCPANTSKPGGEKLNTIWNKFKSFIGAGRCKTRRLRRRKRTKKY